MIYKERANRLIDGAFDMLTTSQEKMNKRHTRIEKMEGRARKTARLAAEIFPITAIEVSAGLLAGADIIVNAGRTRSNSGFEKWWEVRQRPTKKGLENLRRK